MATAVGTYATLSALKLRLNTQGTGEDTLLQALCDQTNSWIESFTGRILAPIPAFSTTLNGAVSPGATTATLTSVTGLSLGDAILFGTVSGTREHGIVVGIAGSVVTLQAALVNAYSNGAAVNRVQLFDGDEADSRVLLAPNGIITLTALEVTPTWNAASSSWNLVPGTDYLLRPTPLDREPGWPATEIHMSPIPSSGNTYPYFAGYKAIARGSGSFGWPAIPDEVVGVSLDVAVAAYRARASGGGETFTIASTGERSFERSLSYQGRKTLMRYTSKSIAIV